MNAGTMELSEKVFSTMRFDAGQFAAEMRLAAAVF